MERSKLLTSRLLSKTVKKCKSPITRLMSQLTRDGSHSIPPVLNQIHLPLTDGDRLLNVLYTKLFCFSLEFDKT